VQSKQQLEKAGSVISSESSKGERAKSALQQLDSSQLKRVMDGVQKLCRLAHPTSKAIEYLQEELDMMLAERRTWLIESQSNRAALTVKQKESQLEIKRLQEQLNLADEHVQEAQRTRQEQISGLWQTHYKIIQAATQLIEQ
jgi:hypothetical protein